jgi:hypothetical protein
MTLPDFFLKSGMLDVDILPYNAFFLTMTERASKSRGSSRLRKAIEYQGVNPDDETGIVSPAEYALKYFMPVADFQVVGYSDNP